VTQPFRIVNAAQARFECTFGRGCEGVCCRNGRPQVYPEEGARIDASLARILPRLRPAARQLVETSGYTSRRRKEGLPMLRVVDGWCVFFHNGCALHQAGIAEDDPVRYKPAACALFPLNRLSGNDWYIRQKGYRGEIWDLFCLDPAASAAPGVESLEREIAIAAAFSK
jgi:hypothetical protein